MPEIMPDNSNRKIAVPEEIVSIPINRRTAVFVIKGLSASVVLSLVYFCFQNFLSLRGLMNVALSRVFLIGAWAGIVFTVWIIGAGSIWRNKVTLAFAVIAAAALIGIDRIAPKPTIPQYQPATANDIQQLKNWYQESHGHTQTSVPSLPGFSIAMLIRIDAEAPGRRNYLFDMGKTNGSRFSCYILNGTLVVSLTERTGKETYSIYAPMGTSVPEASPFLLIASYGFDGGKTVIRTLVGAKVVSSTELPFRVDVSDLAWHEEGGSAVVGASLNADNGSVFDMFELTGFSVAAGSDDLEKSMGYFQNRLINPTFGHFNGKQWARLNQGDNNMTLSSPSIRRRL